MAPRLVAVSAGAVQARPAARGGWGVTAWAPIPRRLVAVAGGGPEDWSAATGRPLETGW